MKHNYLVAKLILILGLSFCYNAQAQGFVEYAKQKQQEVAERRRVEKQKYEEACQKGTLSALQDYAKLYPRSKYITEVNNKIADFALWSHAIILPEF